MGLASAGALATHRAWSALTNPVFIAKSSENALWRGAIAMAEIGQLAIPTGATIVYTTTCVAGESGDMRTVALSFAPQYGEFVLKDAVAGRSFRLVDGLRDCDPESDFLRRPAVLVARKDAESAGVGSASASTYVATVGIYGAALDGNLKSRSGFLAIGPRSRPVPSGVLQENTVTIAQAAASVGTNPEAACVIMQGAVSESLLSLVRHGALAKEIGAGVIAAASGCREGAVSRSTTAPNGGGDSTLLQTQSGHSMGKRTRISGHSQRRIAHASAHAHDHAAFGSDEPRFLRSRTTVRATNEAAISGALDVLLVLALGDDEGRGMDAAPEGMRPLAQIYGGFALDGAATASIESKKPRPLHCLVESPEMTWAKMLAVDAATESYETAMIERERLEKQISQLAQVVVNGGSPEDDLCTRAYEASQAILSQAPSRSPLVEFHGSPKKCGAYRAQALQKHLIDSMSTPGIAPAGKVAYVAALLKPFMKEASAIMGLNSQQLEAAVTNPDLRTELQLSMLFPEEAGQSSIAEEIALVGGDSEDAQHDFTRAAMGGPKKVRQSLGDIDPTADGYCSACQAVMGHVEPSQLLESTGG